MAGWLSGFRAQTGYVVCDVIRCLGEAAAPGGGELRAVPRLCIYTLAFALQLRKITENLSQGSRMALGCLAPKHNLACSAFYVGPSTSAKFCAYASSLEYRMENLRV